jgi:hypothetical protein
LKLFEQLPGVGGFDEVLDEHPHEVESVEERRRVFLHRCRRRRAIRSSSSRRGLRGTADTRPRSGLLLKLKLAQESHRIPDQPMKVLRLDVVPRCA